MPDERWERIESLFHGALERPIGERHAWLQAACGADAELGAEVAALLEAHAVEDSFLASRPALPADLAATMTGIDELEPDARRIGQRLGAWLVIRPIGAGGMGSVYLAERADGQYAQRAALKLVKRGMDSGEIVRRFRAERQILAALDHGNICRLLDGGATDDGLPYFVMEHIDGETIDVYCARRDLPVARRLELFLQICAAVAYAHRQLVVHRDIKPRNVLVGRDGKPKLLDFGVAKLLGPDAETTHADLRLLTPAYASPEQLRGDPVTTATDVHGLGLLLYELLTGRNPFTRGRPPADVARAILEAEPPPPSQAVEPGEARLRRALRGDLDNIVAMALRKDPARRYPSADALAADVLRHLGNQPIQARKEPLLKLAGKFLRRNRVAVLAAATVLVALSAFSILGARQAAQLARERDLVAAERDRARAVSELLVDLFEVDPLSDEDGKSDTVTLRDFLARNEAKVRRELGGQPELKARLLSLLARLYGNLGKLEPARTLGEEALALRRTIGDTGSPELAAVLNHLATVEQDQGVYAAAEEHFRQALRLRRAQSPAADDLVAESMNNLAVLLAKIRPDDDEGIALAERSLELRRRIFGAESPDAAQSLHTLAVAFYFRRRPGDLDQSARLYREALRIRARLLGDHHPNVAIVRSNLAHALRELGRLDDAASMFRSAIDDMSAALGPEHPRVARALVGLSKVRAAQGDLDGAEQALRRAVAIDERTLPLDHPDRTKNALELAELLRRARAQP